MVQRSRELPPARRRGFTLIELLIVVVIIATLSTIVMPQFGAQVQSAGLASIQSNAVRLQRIADVYAAEHETPLPELDPGKQHYCRAELFNASATNPRGRLVADRLRRYTDARGTVCDTRAGGYTYGPYLRGEIPLHPGCQSREITVAERVPRSADEAKAQGIEMPVAWFFATEANAVLAQPDCFADMANGWGAGAIGPWLGLLLFGGWRLRARAAVLRVCPCSTRRRG